jgi:hypothetical protein
MTVHHFFLHAQTRNVKLEKRVFAHGT